MSEIKKRSRTQPSKAVMRILVNEFLSINEKRVYMKNLNKSIDKLEQIVD